MNTADWKKLVDKQKSHRGTEPDNHSLISSYFFIFNCFDNKIEFVNDSFKILTGYEKEQFQIEKLLDIIHPDDMSYFLHCEEKGLQFTNTLSYGEHFRYLMSYTYRIKTALGSYMPLRQQCQAIEVNEKGHLTKTFVTHQRINDDFDRTENDYYIFDKDKNQLLDPQNYFRLTPKERTILDLIQEGLDSAEISDRLFSSKHTVSTHRKNILRKTNCKNFIELSTKLHIIGGQGSSN